MCDLLPGHDRPDRLQHQPAAGFDYAGIGIAGMIGEGADLALGIQIMIGIITKTVFAAPGFRIPVTPHCFAGYDLSLDAADRCSGRKSPFRDDAQTVTNILHGQIFGKAHCVMFF